MQPADDESARMARLRALLARVRREGVARVGESDLFELVRLYRYGASRIAALETTGRDPARLAEMRALVARTHTLLFHDVDRPHASWFERLRDFLWNEVPRAVRAEWRILAASFLLLYGLAAIAYAAVSHDLELAYALFDPRVVAAEIEQLRATAQGEPFRGNFTFGIGESPTTSGWIMAHNMGVGVLCFASGLLPPVYLWLITTNGLMLGTYTGVASHWNQAGEISSILWCHGTLEIQAIVLAAAAGLVLVRAWIAPGAWTRRHAMKIESARAWRLMAPVFPMLFAAGLIEGFVSPHAGTAVRLTTAIGTGVVLVAWIALGGRGPIAARARA